MVLLILFRYLHVQMLKGVSFLSSTPLPKSTYYICNILANIHQKAIFVTILQSWT